MDVNQERTETQSLLASLNQAQKEAVTSDSQHLLILAGAGTGKTRVLVNRIAWLCLEHQYAPRSIFAVTFTNKAANEMSERIRQQMGARNLNSMWIGTFHGLTHRLLRLFYQEAKLPIHFQLIDNEDQARLIKSILNQKKISLDLKPKTIALFILDQKDQGIRSHQVEITDKKTKVLQEIYQEYELICQRLGYVDFSELLLRTYETLKRSESMRQYCHQRFTNILVDEFQDTNWIQYQLVQLLAGKNANVLIVGDDDQAIYSWRGATPDNLQHFIADYEDTEVVRLEQNYRSTPAILEAANSLIQKNTKRLGKKLWTNEADTQKIKIVQAFNDIEEARMAIETIENKHRAGALYDECAILYRNNFQSSILENTLMQNKIPYKIYGSIRFYERAEVKQVLSYLRLLYNADNNLAFEAIINVPKRGIGETTLQKLRLLAQSTQQSLWKASVHALEHSDFTLRQKNQLARFVELMQSIFDEIEDLPLPKQIEKIIHLSGIYALYQSEGSLKGDSKLEHLESLIANADQYYLAMTAQQLNVEPSHNTNPIGQNVIVEAKEKEDDLSILDQFLAYTSLEGQDNRTEPGVQLMTLHGAKGLEFDHVFIVGFEEGLFPSEQSISDLDRLEEERRLAYVGLTRARQSLTLSFCESRRVYSDYKRYLPSRFLFEMDSDTIDFSIRDLNLYGNVPRTSFSNPSLSNETSSSPLYELGSKVIHPRFGEGVIINKEGAGEQLRLQVAFVNQGIKWLVAKLTQLQQKKEP